MSITKEGLLRIFQYIVNSKKQLDVPQNLTEINDLKNDSHILKWNEVDNATSYIVEVKTR